MQYRIGFRKFAKAAQIKMEEYR